MADLLPILQSLTVPILGLAGLVYKARDERHNVKLLERLIAVRQHAPEPTHAELDPLIEGLAAVVRYKELRRLGRRLDGANLAAMIFVLAVGGAVTLFAFTVNTWWSWVVALPIAATALILAWAGSLQTFTYPDIAPPPVLERERKQ